MSNQLEQLFGATLRGPISTPVLSTSGRWSGRTEVASGDTSVVISTTAVGTNDIISLAYQTSVASNTPQGLRVNTIVNNSNFTVGISPAPIGPNFDIMWEIKKGV